MYVCVYACAYKCCIFSLSFSFLSFLSFLVLYIQDISSFVRENYWNFPVIFAVLLSPYCAVGERKYTDSVFVDLEILKSILMNPVQMKTTVGTDFLSPCICFLFDFTHRDQKLFTTWSLHLFKEWKRLALDKVSTF
jgi:hypothetical protein